MKNMWIELVGWIHMPSSSASAERARAAPWCAVHMVTASTARSHTTGAALEPDPRHYLHSMAWSTAVRTTSPGDDFVVEFLDYRYGFSRFDFEQRVTAAAARLELVPQRELQPSEIADLVALAATGTVEQPLSALGRLPGGAPGRDRRAAPRTGELLAAQTGLPWGLAGPSRQDRHARCELRPGLGKLRLPHADRHIAAGRAGTGAVLGAHSGTRGSAGADEHQQMRADLIRSPSSSNCCSIRTPFTKVPLRLPSSSITTPTGSRRTVAWRDDTVGPASIYRSGRCGRSSSAGAPTETPAQPRLGCHTRAGDRGRAAGGGRLSSGPRIRV